MNIIKRIKAYLCYRTAVTKADRAHEKTGERYYVMPSVTTNGKPKLIVVDRKNFRILKRKHYIKDCVFVRDMIAEAFYMTPYADGQGWLTPKDIRRRKQQFYLWYAGL